jgi:hypothetical protein
VICPIGVIVARRGPIAFGQRNHNTLSRYEARSNVCDCLRLRSSVAYRDSNEYSN